VLGLPAGVPGSSNYCNGACCTDPTDTCTGVYPYTGAQACCAPRPHACGAKPLSARPWVCVLRRCSPIPAVWSLLLVVGLAAREVMRSLEMASQTLMCRRKRLLGAFGCERRHGTVMKFRWAACHAMNVEKLFS